jgi:hypothetical protein
MKLLSNTMSQWVVGATSAWDDAVQTADHDAMLVAGNELARLLTVLQDWDQA